LARAARPAARAAALSSAPAVHRRLCIGRNNRAAGEKIMSKELYWLTLTAAMTAILWVPYILDRIIVRGVIGATANPSPNDKPQSAWAERMMAAHTNAVENLVVFVPLVLVAHELNIHTAATVFACALYFWCRLAHVAVYTAGIPLLRTLAFAGGWIAQIMLVMAIFGMA
jgi:uncharacterized MAPEG superfamily protein